MFLSQTCPYLSLKSNQRQEFSVQEV